MFPTKATGIRFNQCGLSVTDARIKTLEKMKTCDENYRKKMERYLIFINKFDTYYKEISRMPYQSLSSS